MQIPPISFFQPLSKQSGSKSSTNMENPGYDNNNGDVTEMKDFKETKKDEEDLWELPELKTDEKSWKGM